MKIRHTDKEAEKIQLQMTPMIDIVFQLLVFFIMTFKIVAIEGDFNIKMPLAAPRKGRPDENQLPPIKVRMRAGSGGRLSSLLLNDRSLPGDTIDLKFDRLHMEIHQIVGDERGPGSVAETAEVELDCDYELNYEHVIQAITAVSGYITDNDIIVKLVEKIKFAPPRKPSG